MIPSVEEIEVALLHYFKIRQCICLPTTIMFFGHEIDFLAVRRDTQYAVEVEIKRSVSDMKAEEKKIHCHESNKIVQMYYCFPKDILEKCIPLVPERAGILSVRWIGYKWKVYKVRNSKRNMTARKLTDAEVFNIYKSSNYRIWSFKKKIVKLQKKINDKGRKITKNKRTK